MNTIQEAERIMANALSLMKKKNEDYGDSWREMRPTSITDQILVKVMRIRTLEESDDAPKVSEGIESEYRDILNYCVFALIKIGEADIRTNKAHITQILTTHPGSPADRFSAAELVTVIQMIEEKKVYCKYIDYPRYYLTGTD